MTECKKCHIEIFWNKEDHERTGKWRPFDDQGNPHNCRKKNTFKYGISLDLPNVNFTGYQCTSCGGNYGELGGPCLNCKKEIAVVKVV